MRVPWTARSNESILKEINPEYSLEGQRLKLKVQYFGHLMRKADSLEKTVILGKTTAKRGEVQPRMKWLDSISDPMVTNLSKLQKIGEDKGAWHAIVHEVTESWTQLSN